MSFGFLVTVAFVVNFVTGYDFQFTGCFIYLSNHSDIQEGWYEHRNLSSSTCSRDCQLKFNITSFFALARRSLCLCDSNLENFEATYRVKDERCQSSCINSSDNTKYCGGHDTLAIYTVNPLLKCYELSELVNGSIIYEKTVVKFECDQGYVLSHNNNLTCERMNGSWEWSGPQPHCLVYSGDQGSLSLTIVLQITLILLITSTIGCSVLGFSYKRKHNVRLCPSPFSSYRRGNLPSVTVQTNTVFCSDELVSQKPPPIPPREIKNPINKDMLEAHSFSVNRKYFCNHINAARNSVSKGTNDNENENCEEHAKDMKTLSNYVMPNSHHEDHESVIYEWTRQLSESSDKNHQDDKKIRVKPPIAPRTDKINCRQPAIPKYTRVKKGTVTDSTLAFSSTEENDREYSPHCQVYLDVL